MKRLTWWHLTILILALTQVRHQTIQSSDLRLVNGNKSVGNRAGVLKVDVVQTNPLEEDGVP